MVWDRKSLPLRLAQNLESNYYLVDPLLPLLNKHDSGGDSVSEAAGALDAEEEGRLLQKYGVLVDTDGQGRKWITKGKMVELLRLLSLYDTFQDWVEEEQVTDNDIDSESGHSHDNEGGVSSGNDHNHNHNHAHETNENDNTEASGTGDGNTENTNNKRPGAEHTVALGSPLKKAKHTGKEIVTFSHDLAPIDSPLRIQRAQRPLENFGSEERVKLENLLQRILFPDTGSSASRSSSRRPSASSPSPLFASALQDLSAAYPDTKLNLNIPIDEHGNTPLHWLCSIANIGLIKDLICHRSNRLLGDKLGESPLVKAVKSVNNYDSGTFEELLDYLYPCLLVTDEMDRTVLHHIVITSGMPGCSGAAKYYLDILMGWIVKKQSRTVVGRQDPVLEGLSLQWFIANILNAKDSNGDTCLNIASRLGNVSIVEALLDYGADSYITNKSGLRPIDFGAGVGTAKTGGLGAAAKLLDSPGQARDEGEGKVKSEGHGAGVGAGAGVGSGETPQAPDSSTLINSIQSLLSTISQDYETELKQHQSKLDELHHKLNSQREQLATSRDRLAQARHLRDEYSILTEQLANIEQGIREEELHFQDASRDLLLPTDEASSLELETGEFDADEPFRVDFIYEFIEKKLRQDYNGDLDRLLQSEAVEDLIKQVLEQNSGKQETIPPAVLLRARIRAYKRNDAHLDQTLEGIQTRQSDLEAKFRRVLSLCLKVEENKVDGMLDGLLQAISTEDPEEVDMDEMQDFLKKHST